MFFRKEGVTRVGIIISYKAPYFLIQSSDIQIPFSVRLKQIMEKVVRFEFSIPDDNSETIQSVSSRITLPVSSQITPISRNL